MECISTKLPEVKLITPQIFEDARGYFFESYVEQRYEQAGISDRFVQQNVSRSHQGVLRGLHYQWPRAQAKLVSVLEGRVLDVVKSSSTPQNLSKTVSF